MGVRGEDGVGMGKGNTRGQLSGPPGKVGTGWGGGGGQGPRGRWVRWRGGVQEARLGWGLLFGLSDAQCTCGVELLQLKMAPWLSGCIKRLIGLGQARRRNLSHE